MFQATMQKFTNRISLLLNQVIVIVEKDHVYFLRAAQPKILYTKPLLPKIMGKLILMLAFQAPHFGKDMPTTKNPLQISNIVMKPHLVHLYGS